MEFNRNRSRHFPGLILLIRAPAHTFSDHLREREVPTSLFVKLAKVGTSAKSASCESSQGQSTTLSSEFLSRDVCKQGRYSELSVRLTDCLVAC